MVWARVSIDIDVSYSVIIGLLARLEARSTSMPKRIKDRVVKMGLYPSFDQVNKINRKELNSATKSAIKMEPAYLDAAKAR